MTKIKNLFSLIELLVVIAVLSLIMALLYPALNKAYQQAATLTCSNQMRGVSMALSQYLSDYNHLFPIGVRWNNPFDDQLSSYDGRNLSEQELNMKPILNTEEHLIKNFIYICPSSKRREDPYLPRTTVLNNGTGAWYKKNSSGPVSYTHLTLPTICSV